MFISWRLLLLLLLLPSTTVIIIRANVSSERRLLLQNEASRLVNGGSSSSSSSNNNNSNSRESSSSSSSSSSRQKKPPINRSVEPAPEDPPPFIDRRPPDHSVEYRLYHNLIGMNSRYLKHVRPVSDHHDAIVVEVGMSVMMIEELIERDQIMVMAAAIKMKWTDAFLSWDPRHYGNLTWMAVSSNAIWVPDISIVNSPEPFSMTRKVTHVDIDYNGEVGFYPSGRLMTRCNLHITYFPFDHQHCEVFLESWIHPSEYLRIVPYEKYGSTVDIKEYYTNHQWAILSYEVNLGSADYDGKNFSSITFVYMLKRKSQYYFMYYIFPQLLLAFLQTLSHTLPVEHPGRMAMLTSLFIGTSVTQAGVAVHIPKSSESMSLLQIYMTMMSCNLVLALIVTFVMMYAVLRYPNEEPSLQAMFVAFFSIVWPVRRGDDEDEDKANDEGDNRWPDAAAAKNYCTNASMIKHAKLHHRQSCYTSNIESRHDNDLEHRRDPILSPMIKVCSPNDNHSNDLAYNASSILSPSSLLSSSTLQPTTATTTTKARPALPSPAMLAKHRQSTKPTTTVDSIPSSSSSSSSSASSASSSSSSASMAVGTDSAAAMAVAQQLLQRVYNQNNGNLPRPTIAANGAVANAGNNNEISLDEQQTCLYRTSYGIHRVAFPQNEDLSLLCPSNNPPARLAVAANKSNKCSNISARRMATEHSADSDEGGGSNSSSDDGDHRRCDSSGGKGADDSSGCQHCTSCHSRSNKRRRQKKWHDNNVTNESLSSTHPRSSLMPRNDLLFHQLLAEQQQQNPADLTKMIHPMTSNSDPAVFKLMTTTVDPPLHSLMTGGGPPLQHGDADSSVVWTLADDYCRHQPNNSNNNTQPLLSPSSNHHRQQQQQRKLSHRDEQKLTPSSETAAGSWDVKNRLHNRKQSSSNNQTNKEMPSSKQATSNSNNNNNSNRKDSRVSSNFSSSNNNYNHHHHHHQHHKHKRGQMAQADQDTRRLKHRWLIYCVALDKTIMYANLAWNIAAFVCLFVIIPYYAPQPVYIGSHED